MSAVIRVALAYVLLVVGHAYGSGRNPRCHWAFFFLIVGIMWYPILSKAPEEEPDKALGSIAPYFLLTASDFILLRNWQPEVRMIGQTVPSSTFSFWQRLKMSNSLMLTPRNIGFTTEPTNRLRLTPPKTTRTQFVVSGLQWLCCCGLLLDAFSVMKRSLPMFHAGGMSFSECGWLWRSSIWLHIFVMGFLVSTTYNIISIVTVGLGICRPQDWPAPFGSLKDAYTVRNCWGRVWHQTMRKKLTGHGEAFANILGLPKGTFRTYFKLYVAFFVSGVEHILIDRFVIQVPGSTAIKFFVLQAAVITFEDAIIGIAKRLGVTKTSPLTKLVGFCWVFVWYTISAPYWLEPVFQVGPTSTKSQLSLVQYLWGALWKGAKGAAL